MIPSQIFCCHFQNQNNGELEVRALEMSPDYFSFRLSRKRDGEVGKMQHFPAKLIFYRQEGAREGLQENRMNELRVNEPQKSSPENSQEFDIFREVSVAEYRITKTAVKEFWTEYRFETSDPVYRMEATRLLKEYGSYIRLRLEETDAETARILTGYPVDETKISKTFALQKAAWAEELKKADGIREILASNCEIGLALDEPALWEAYRDSESWNEFVEWYCRNRVTEKASEKTLGEKKNPFHRELSDLLAEKCRYLYVGNSFCPHLYPDSATLQELRKRADRDRKTIVYVFSTMSEYMITIYRERLEELKRWPAADLQRSRYIGNHRNEEDAWSEEGEADRMNTGQQTGISNDDERNRENADGCPEIVVNDAGMLSMLRESGENRFFHITYGVIPIRRRKDPRLLWKKEPERWKIHRTTVNDGAFLRELQEAGVDRLSFETCGYVPDLPKNSGEKTQRGNITVYFPYYQMNTSTWCTTYAMCHNGKRGRQEEAERCPGYCRSETFLYPDDLHMVGRFNSLFGLDYEAMENVDRIRDYVRQGADRIVLNFL
ncbi:MAG: hypothetical protein LIV11_05655 [Bacillota bacterium]|nr:hypothetical protein [Bacillota bacterium]